MNFQATNLVDWHKPTPDGCAETLKWRIANASYEIHQVVLEEIEMAAALPAFVNRKAIPRESMAKQSTTFELALLAARPPSINKSC